VKDFCVHFPYLFEKKKTINNNTSTLTHQKIKMATGNPHPGYYIGGQISDDGSDEFEPWTMEDKEKDPVVVFTPREEDLMKGASCNRLYDTIMLYKTELTYDQIVMFFSLTDKDEELYMLLINKAVLYSQEEITNAVMKIVMVSL
jgi:hypothetical protein